MTESERQECPRVPIWVGAVGHRRLWAEKDAELRRAVGEVLDDVMRRLGPGLEPHLLTSLAEGADQIVAEEARARGWALGVPLPLPVALYERDFGSHATLETFRRLREQAVLVFDVGLAPGVSLDQVRGPGAAREAQYARAGRVLAATCPIMIALWDGEKRNLVGGTSELIARVRYGWREEDDLTRRLDPRPPRLVYHVWTPSHERPDVTGTPFTWEILRAKPEHDFEGESHVVADVLARFGELDRDACEEHGLDEERDRSVDEALPPEHAATLPREIRQLLRWYGIADALALRFQRRVRWALPGLLVAAVTGFAGYELHTHLEGAHLWGLEMFLLFFASMIVAVRWIQARAHERKFLDYRALAEGLRVQLFWRLCGIPDSVSEHYLRRHRGELSWIPMAIASLSVGAEFPPIDEAGGALPLGRRRRLAREWWLDRQREFFARNAHRAERMARRSFVMAYGLLGLAMAVVAYLWFAGRVLGHHPSGDPHEHWIHIGIGVTLAASAAFRHFVERRGFETDARRYGLMHLLASRALEAVGDDRDSLESESAAAVFREFGRESLAENGDWLLLHRERPLEVPPPA